MDTPFPTLAMLALRSFGRLPSPRPPTGRTMVMQIPYAAVSSKMVRTMSSTMEHDRLDLWSARSCATHLGNMTEMDLSAAPRVNWASIPLGSLATFTMCMGLMARQSRRTRSWDIGLNFLVLAEGLTGSSFLVMTEGPRGVMFGAASNMMPFRNLRIPLAARYIRVVRSKRVGPSFLMPPLASVVTLSIVGRALAGPVIVLLTLAGPALGVPRPATHFLVALARRHIGDGCSGAIMISGFLAATNLCAMRLAAISLPCSAALPGWRLTGCTSRTTAGATAASSCGTLRLSNVDALTNAVLAARNCPAPSPPPRTRLPALPPPRCHAAQFGGGLVLRCSRLGRQTGRIASRWESPSPRRKFEGTVPRCLGPLLAALVLSDVDKRTFSLPGIRTWLSPWPIMLNESPSVLVMVVPLRGLLLPAAWPPSASAWPPALLHPPPELGIQWRQLGLGASPSRRRCMVTAATRTRANRRQHTPLLGMRSMLYPKGATTSLVV